jgi:intracellular multiplication protein IcmO
MSRNIRGLYSEEEYQTKRLLRNTDSILKQVLSAFNRREIIFTFLFMIAACMIVIPALTLVLAFIGFLLVYARVRTLRKDRLPFRLPQIADRKDLSDPIPGRKKYFKSQGIFYLGNEERENSQLWFKLGDVLTHMLVFGTTGSGKTETLVSFAFNALAMGSGFFYIDPKAAPKLATQIYMMCRMCGRDDDYRILNYLTQGKPQFGSRVPKKMSNTNNPFAFGSAESLTQLIVSLIPPAEGSNAIFSQNAQTLVTALMYALVEMRDKGEVELDIGTIREYMTLNNYTALAERKDLSIATIGALESFLTSVGWQKGKGQQQPRSLAEQYGYARSYFGLSLASLTDTYGHIYATNKGEVDMYDCIKNRRVLVTMLPSLEKSPQELQNLGKIALSAVRTAIAIGLGSSIEGTVEDVLDSLPTDSPKPFLSITDEYAAIPTPGYAEVLTQGRGLGVGAIVASQDYAGIKKADEAGAQQIVANTKIKLAMKLEEAEATWDLFNKLAGDAKVMQTDGFSLKNPVSGNAGINYRDQQSAKVGEMGRIHKRDLQEQIEGEFHAFFNGDVVRGRSFYANPPLEKAQQVRLATMLKVEDSELSELKEKLGELDEIIKIFHKKAKSTKDEQNFTPDGIENLSLFFGDKKNKKSNSVKSILTFLKWVDDQDARLDTEEATTEDLEEKNKSDIVTEKKKESDDNGLLPDMDDMDFMIDDESEEEVVNQEPKKVRELSNYGDIIKTKEEWLKNTDPSYEEDMHEAESYTNKIINSKKEVNNKAISSVGKNIGGAFYPRKPHPDKSKTDIDQNFNLMLSQTKIKAKDSDKEEEE